MTLKREHRIIAHHAAAVIDNTNESTATRFDFHADVGRTSVERILQQFFHDAGRPLDNLPGRDLVGNGVGEYSDLSHLVRTNTTLRQQSARPAIKIEQIAAILHALRDQITLRLGERVL